MVGVMYDGPYDHGMYAGAWFMVLFWLVLLATVGVLVVVAVRAGRGPDRGVGNVAGAMPRSGPEIGSPRDLLDQRLARGEISAEEYRSTRALLEA